MDESPGAFCFSLAQSCRSIGYARLYDITEIQKSIAQGLPVAVGFTCFESIDTPDGRRGWIATPGPKERALGAHAVLAVGYMTEGPFKDHLIIRNSWGVGWGVQGYGVLPFRYVCREPNDCDALSNDYWTAALAAVPYLPGGHAPLYATANWPQTLDAPAQKD